MSIESLIIAGSSIAAVAGTVMAHGLFSPRSRLFGPVTFRGATSGLPRVALTFDDGPHPSATDAIREILARHNVPATFFVVGSNVMRWPDVVKRLASAGHEIGNHSFDHAYTGLFHGRLYWEDQLRRTTEAIRSVIGTSPSMFRPPMGFKHPPIFVAARNCGQRIVTWTRRGFDALRTSSEKIHDRLATRAAAGDILLMHDGAPPGRERDPQATIDAVEPLINTLRARSIQIVPLCELIATTNVPPRPA